MRVFVSYSHIDSKFVQELAAVLDAKKVPHFLDKKSIEWGDSIPRAVEEGLQDSSHLIVVVSPASLKSSWVPYEIGLARAMGLKILPLLTHPSLDLPGFIATLSHKSTLDEIAGFFDENVRRSSTLELSLMAGHMDIIHTDEGDLFGVNYLDPEKDEVPGDLLPYFELSVKNIGMDSIGVEVPMVEFAKTQGLPGNENTYNAIGFFGPAGGTRFTRLRPQGKASFQSHSFSSCLVAQGFLDDNVKRICLEDDQAFVSEVGMSQLESAAIYCRWFFATVDLNELLKSKFGEPGR
jgi:hypothetical protein